MDIRVDSTLFQKRKYRRLTARCGKLAGLGLIELWAWASLYAQDGDLGDMSDEEIAHHAEWDGDPVEFAAALRESDERNGPWLDPDGHLHDWEEHEWYVVDFKNRSQRARENVKRRWDRRHQIPQSAPAKLERAVAKHERPAPPPDPEPAQQEPPHAKEKDVLFERFWLAYPRRIGKGAALRAWKKLPDKAQTLALCLDALSWQTTQEQWTRDAGQYVPHPATYLNAHRWLDEKQAEDTEREPVRPMEPMEGV